MNESAATYTPESTDPAANDIALAAVRAGDMLRAAREGAGLHIATLAVSLKVPVRKLEALEAGRFDLLPDSVFVRALAASVCRTLKIDPAPVLALLPQSTGPRLAHNESGINAPFRSPEDHARAPWLQRLASRPAALAALVLVVAAAALVLVPRIGGSEDEAAPKSAGAADPTVASAADTPAATPPRTVVAAPVEPVAPSGIVQQAVEPHVTAPTKILPPAQPVQTTPPAVPVVAAVPPPVSAKPAPVLAASSAPVARNPAPAEPSPGALPAIASTGGLVTFQASAESWIEVLDARGQPSLRRALQAGETASVNGALPLSIVIGRADATRVQVRGKPFDLQPVARDNVARFEVR